MTAALLTEWYDLRDLGNPVQSLLQWIDGWGDGRTCHWVAYSGAGLVGAAVAAARSSRRRRARS